MTDTPLQNVYRFCPQCGIANPNVGAVPFRCAACEFAQFFGPVGAVGGIVVNDKDEMLLVRRARNPGLGKFGLPGGFVDQDETIEDALAREIREETSLEIISFEYLTSFPNTYRYKGIALPVIDLFYVCQVDSSAPVELAKDELTSYYWCRPTQAELSEMAFPSNRKAVEAWLGAG